MKNSAVYLTLALFAATIAACDKVENPIKPAILVDTNLYPGNWDDYPYPTFTANTNTDRNVLLEDYTGHRCPNCPAAASVGEAIEAANASRVFIASVHAGPGGLSGFQQLASDCGTITNPTNEFCTIFYNTESLAYGAAFQTGYGFFGNPQGTINRITFSGSSMFQFSTDWQTRVDEVLTANDLKINLQAQANYYPETNGMYLHVESEFLQDMTGEYNLVVYVLENEVIDFQDSATIILEDYRHENILRGCIDGLPWGRSITGNHTTGEKTYYDYSYEFPTGQVNTDFHFLIYAYDVATYEVLQVIKYEF
ncbi:MAG: Omp28-related outer membrane protein [Bacteroidetes bacterium]|nr:Omp28-related outer membrane protein [Bacteroidota bacterium]